MTRSEVRFYNTRTTCYSLFFYPELSKLTKESSAATIRGTSRRVLKTISDYQESFLIASDEEAEKGVDELKKRAEMIVEQIKGNKRKFYLQAVSFSI